jgi:hypothetical protein
MKKHSKTDEAKRRPRRPIRQWKPPRVKRFPIAVARQLPVVWLDANYGVEEDGVTRISGRTPEGRAGKDCFQHDGVQYANALGQALAVYGGFTEQRVTRNRGHALDAGSVMATYYHPKLPYWLSLYIESDRSKTAIPRPDGVIILACRRTYRQSGNRERIHFLNPAMSSLQLALVLLLLVGLKKAGDLEDQHLLAQASDLQPQPLFGDEPTGRRSRPQPGERPHMVVRVWLIGAYRQCMLLRPGRTSVEVVCIDDHPRLALSYWGRRITQPLARVHPDDQSLCALPGAERIPGQAHLASGQAGGETTG